MPSPLTRHRIPGLLLILFASLPVAIAQSAPADAPSVAVTQSSQSAARSQGFFKRWFNAYVSDWKGTDADSAEPPRRIPPAPLTSPPFPSADWTYGGSSVIGATNTTNFLQAIPPGSFLGVVLIVFLYLWIRARQF